MIKFHLIFVIGIISAFLLTVQWIILQMTVKNASIEVNHQWSLMNLVNKLAIKNNIPLFVIDRKILFNLHSTNAKHQTNIRKESYQFTDQINDRINNLFKSQSFSLRQTVKCDHFCSGQKVIHLATLQEISIYQELTKFIEQLKAEQLTVLEFNEFDTSLLIDNIHLHLVNHLIIFRDQHQFPIKQNSNLIHITIFQERLKKFWISQSIHLTEFEKRLIHRQGVRKLHFQFSDHNHVYEKTSLVTKHIDGLLLNYPEEIDIFLQDPKLVQFIECNKTRAKQFYKQYGDDDSESALQFKMSAYHLLYKVKLILDDLGIPFWLSSGTCLGYFRQCDFISYSQDVDIGIFIKDYRDDLIDVFSINGLPLIHLFGKYEDSFELSFRNGDVKLDIFFFYEENDHFWNGGTQAKSGLKFKYIFPKFELCWTEFLELLVRVPCDTQTYITANYGSNWFKKIKQWDWKTSPSNVIPNGQWPIDEWLNVIQTNPYTDLV